MPLDIEQKVDYNPGSTGKHYAEEINAVTNTLNSSINALGDQDPAHPTDQLTTALAVLDSNTIYKGIVDTSKTPNEITLTSKVSSYLKSYADVGYVLFAVDVATTDAVKLGIGELSKKSITEDGVQLTAGALKPNNVYFVDLSGSEGTLSRVSSLLNSDNTISLRPPLTGDSLDEVRLTGIYDKVDIPSTGLSYPVLEKGVLKVSKISENFILQEYTTKNMYIYIRVYNGTIWSTWKAINPDDNREFLDIVAGTLLNNDLNVVKNQGVYRQEDYTLATQARHYPENINGLLKVFKLGTDNNGNPIIKQEYITVNRKRYTRTYLGIWSDWLEHDTINYSNGVITDNQGDIITLANVIAIDRTGHKYEFKNTSVGDVDFLVSGIDETSSIDVYYMGVLLSTDEYTVDIPGNKISLSEPIANDGEIVTIKIIGRPAVTTMNMPNVYYNMGEM